MSLRLRLTILVCMILVAVHIINMVRRQRINFRYALGWLLVDICILVLDIWPVLLDKIAWVIGIASPVNMLFFFGFILAVIIIFSLTMSVSRLSEKVRRLSQEIAIIRKDVHDEFYELQNSNAIERRGQK